MNSDRTQKEASVEVEITEPNPAMATMFAPQRRNSSIGVDSPTPNQNPPPAPEKNLTLFALRLAIIEKAATGLGTLGFIWATVVLLGGFAITLEKTDFWFITVILLTEATRIYGRSHELEWQHQATRSPLSDARRSSSRFLVYVVDTICKPITTVGSSRREINGGGKTQPKKRFSSSSRQWEPSEVPLLSKNVSRLLNWMQIIAGIACVVLSLMKLIRHDYGDVDASEKRNRNAALIIFYSLALAEASLFLLEKAYWEYKVNYCKLLEAVSSECELREAQGIASVRRFFYDAYSKCLDGSVFDGLKMDMVSFAMELLVSDSNSFEEQLIGARILCIFAKSVRFSEDTLEKIGLAFSVIERLVAILNWKDPMQEEIRNSAATILTKLAGKKQNSLRVAGIPGAMESISSLLHTENRQNLSQKTEEAAEKSIEYEFWSFNDLALQLLKKLARDHDNCGKIGNTRGLLPKIIEFTHSDETILKEQTVPESQILIKRSLKLVRMLASTTGNTGKQLRREISENVFTISNIRDILRYGDKRPDLQLIGIEILCNLAMEDDATERIGGTGGILKELLKIFFTLSAVSVSAGEALAMLALESTCNCRRILRLGAIDELVNALDNQLLRETAATILKNLCIYSGEDCFGKLRAVVAGVPTIIKGIKSEDSKLQEVMVGLGATAFKFMTPEEAKDMFARAGMTAAKLADTIVGILRKYPNPNTSVPRVRRFSIELAIMMMREQEKNIRIFRSLKMEEELEKVLETTYEIESFTIFSGSVGLSRYGLSIHSLVQTALDLLTDNSTVCMQ
ncbi:hypothetical protein V2J09_011424 [Rumex salicifolius]